MGASMVLVVIHFGARMQNWAAKDNMRAKN
jgi:hypothetical protein